MLMFAIGVGVGLAIAFVLAVAYQMGAQGAMGSTRRSRSATRERD